MTDPLRSTLAVAAVVLVVLVAGCGQTKEPTRKGDPPTATSPALPSGVGPLPTLLVVPGVGGTTAEQLGTAHVRISVASTAGGRVTTGPGPDGDEAFRFPRFTTNATYPRAVLRVVSSGGDPLDPGERPFTWGADFKLDERSSAPTGVDNGDNLIQRGLSSEPALFKAELDDDRPACEVRGAAGTLIVRASHLVVPGIWYRLRCSRVGDDLTLSVVLLDAEDDPSGKVVDDRRSRTGPTGTVHMVTADVPVSIGGKVAVNGMIIAQATDQFNGWIANPVVEIGKGAG